MWVKAKKNKKEFRTKLKILIMNIFTVITKVDFIKLNKIIIGNTIKALQSKRLKPEEKRKVMNYELNRINR